jgi:hypothetical protein
MFIAGEEPRRQSWSSFPVSAPQSTRFGTALASEKWVYSSEYGSADSVLPLSILMEVRVLEHGTGVSVMSRYKPFFKSAFFWHHKWACPPRCVLDRSVLPAYPVGCSKCCSSIRHTPRWTRPLDLWCQKRQIFKTACNGYSHSHLVVSYVASKLLGHF